ncbi:hypothetical protein J6590_084084 [Homalodisca vitripennis]|nr:hypothetical protein J6590_084084 [Homalodisca vitripennis]
MKQCIGVSNSFEFSVITSVNNTLTKIDQCQKLKTKQWLTLSWGQQFLSAEFTVNIIPHVADLSLCLHVIQEHTSTAELQYIFEIDSLFEYIITSTYLRGWPWECPTSLKNLAPLLAVAAGILFHDVNPPPNPELRKLYRPFLWLIRQALLSSLATLPTSVMYFMFEPQWGIIPERVRHTGWGSPVATLSPTSVSMLHYMIEDRSMPTAKRDLRSSLAFGVRNFKDQPRQCRSNNDLNNLSYEEKPL